MSAYVRQRVTVVWAILVAATCLSWYLGTAPGGLSADVEITVILAVAVTKMWLVGRHFMELRTAPRTLALLFDAYAVVIFGVLAGMYLLG